MAAARFNFTGLICPVLTAFANDKKRTIRYDVIEKYAAWLKQKGVKGVLVNGTNGEGVNQRPDERKRSLDEWLRSCKKNDLSCMVHIGGAGISTVRDLAEHAEENKVEAVLCLADLFFRPKCEEDVVHYLKDIAEYCPTRPIFYYHFPAYTGLYLSMPRLCDLAEREIPTFNGIKFTSNDLHEGVACLKTGRKVFLGSNTTFLGALTLGFDSAILATLNVWPEYALQIYAAMENNRLEEAQRLQKELTERLAKNGPSVKAEFNRINPDFAVGPARSPPLNTNLNK